jgi:guanylate kinase
MRAAARDVPNLEILQTTTTRPRRPDEADVPEYIFVSDAVYERLRAASKTWDHLEYHGYKYGADAGVVRQKLDAGINLICTITPDMRAVRMMEHAYDVSASTIWIDVPAGVAAGRVAHDDIRAARVEDDSAKLLFQRLFTPSDKLAEDEVEFATLVRSLL